MFARWTIAFVFAFLTLSCAGAAKRAETASNCEQPLALAQGRISGVAADEQTCAWKGIPFAQSGPDYRLRKPGPPPPVGEDFVATEFGPGCLAPLLGFVAPAGTDEDCLSLNIWRPAGGAELQQGERLPVMVWIYGGAFLLGSGSWMVYDGASLAKRGVIVVTINYRLGPLGFYGSAAQQAADPEGASGNWGIWDQIAALQWVRDNISAFGGDPANVTIFGESAGGFSVCSLLVAPAAEGLFHRAIMQSGGCLANSLAERHAFSKQLITETPCAGAQDEAACLREIEADDLNLHQAMWEGSAPTVDGVLLREQPIDAIRNGRAHPVPLLIGANRDELRPLALMPAVAWALSTSKENFWRRVAASRDSLAVNTMQALYPAVRKDARDLWSEIATDIFFRCTVVNVAEAHARVAPVYAYEFDIDERANWTGKQMGAYHSVEIPYVFGFTAWPRLMNPGTGSESRAIAYTDKMQTYWVSFAKYGDPNRMGLAGWPEYAGTRTITRINPTKNVPLAGYRQKQCKFWDVQAETTFPSYVKTFADFSKSAGVSLYPVFR